MQFISKFFKLEEHQTTVKREFVAGLTTFLSMAYILIVNPAILGVTTMNPGRVFTATAIAAIAGTLIMGLLANYPAALAPGMGMNAFFTFTICGAVASGGFGYSWQLALAAVFVSGVIFMAISATGVRQKIIDAIPKDLKYAVGSGIGLFIAFVGLQNAGIIVGNPDTLVNLGDLSSPGVILAIIGLIITVILYLLRVPAAIFLGIVLTSVIGIIWRAILSSMGKLTEAAANVFPQFPKSIISLPSAPHFGAFVDGFRMGDWGTPTFWLTFGVVVFSLLFMDFFDTAGTLMSVGTRCGFIDEEGKLKGSNNAFFADASATVIGAVAGTSSTTTYVESLSGVEVGGRTGLTAVFTALFFVIAIFFSDLLLIVTSPVTAPALIFVGVLMASQFSKINWHDIAVAIPSFLTIIFMPLAYSISEGIAVGFVFYPISMLASKRGKEINKIMYILSLIFIFYFVIKAVR